jgi:hypothetical protein
LNAKPAPQSCLSDVNIGPTDLRACTHKTACRLYPRKQTLIRATNMSAALSVSDPRTWYHNYRLQHARRFRREKIVACRAPAYTRFSRNNLAKGSTPKCLPRKQSAKRQAAQMPARPTIRACQNPKSQERYKPQNPNKLQARSSRLCKSAAMTARTN